jgi:hypothetical protein
MIPLTSRQTGLADVRFRASAQSPGVVSGDCQRLARAVDNFAAGESGCIDCLEQPGIVWESAGGVLALAATLITTWEKVRLLAGLQFVAHPSGCPRGSNRVRLFLIMH